MRLDTEKTAEETTTGDVTASAGEETVTKRVRAKKAARPASVSKKESKVAKKAKKSAKAAKKSVAKKSAKTKVAKRNGTVRNGEARFTMQKENPFKEGTDRFKQFSLAQKAGDRNKYVASGGDLAFLSWFMRSKWGRYLAA